MQFSFSFFLSFFLQFQTKQTKNQAEKNYTLAASSFGRPGRHRAVASYFALSFCSFFWPSISFRAVSWSITKFNEFEVDWIEDEFEDELFPPVSSTKISG